MRDAQRDTLCGLLAIGVIVSIAVLVRPEAVALPNSDQRGNAEESSAIGEKQLFKRLPVKGREGTLTGITAPEWRQILLRTWDAVSEDRVFAVAAGVTFYLLLAFVPAITAFISIFGMFAQRDTIVQQLELLSGIVPREILPLIGEQMTRIAAAGDTAMTFASVIALSIAAWSANGATKALIEALNVAYDTEETRSFVRLTLISFFFTGGAIGLGICAITAVAVMPGILSYIPNPGLGAKLALWLRWPILLGVLLIALATLYRFGPDRKGARWHWISPGAVVATVLFMPFSIGFSIYAAKFADFNGTYGSLGAVMGFLLWLWVASIIVLMGAELNAEADKIATP